MGVKCRAVLRAPFVQQIVVCLSLPFLVTACTENGTPPQIEAHVYSNAPAPARCQAGARDGRAGASDGEVSAEGLRYHVRTPSNYDATIAHPLLMVYAAAGQSGHASERMTGLTPTATAAGFVVVYADHRPLGIPAIEQLGTIPGSVAKRWCIDEKRVYVTGHSDGGTAALALAVLDKTKHVPTVIAPSAAGWTGKDLEAYQCPDPIPVMVLHGANDRLFPGWGAQTAAWWASCNQCDVGKTRKIEGGCVAYQGCTSGGATLYCEGTGSHRDWPNLNRVMLDFFSHPGKFL
jgi:polyhydroxybutyrate depolymerase